MKKIFFVSFVLVVGYSVLFLWESPPESGDPQIERISARRAALSALPDRRNPGFASPAADLNAAAVVGQTAQSPAQAAEAFLAAHKEEWGIRPYHELRPEVMSNPMGSFVRFQAFQNGLPIIGSQIELRVSPDNQVTLASMNYQPVEEADFSEPMLEREDLLTSISDRYVPAAPDLIPTPVLFTQPGSTPVPAFALAVQTPGATGQPMRGVFRASDGQLLQLLTGRPERVPTRASNGAQ